MAQRKLSNLRAARHIEPLLREPVDRFELSNGLIVLVRPDHSAPVVSVQVWIKSGSIHEGSRLGSGISHYLEHMLFKGTERRAGRDISALVQAHGGYINAYTSYDRTVYYIDLPAEHVTVALDLLADAIFGSTLPAEEVAKEQEVILREIDMGLDDPDYRVSQALMEAAFRAHPYRYPIIGHKEVFSRLRRDDLVAYYRDRYVPNNAVVVIAGDVETERLRPEIERLFQEVPRAPLGPVLVPDEPGQLAGREVGLVDDVQVFRAALGYQVPGLAHPDTPALDVLSLILGHGDSSVLWQRLRERRKLVHHIEASNWNPGSNGLFYISFAGDPENGPRAMLAVQEEVAAACRRGFTVSQLQKAVRQAIVAEVNVRRSMSGQAARLGVAEVVVGDLGYPATYLERLARLTPADLQRVGEVYLRPAHLTVSTLGPKTRSAGAVVAPASNASSFDFEEIRLGNGARILLRENHRLPQVHLRVAWQGGPAFEDPERYGSTSLLATLLTRDTKKRSAAEVARAIEAVGGSLAEFSGNNSFGLSAEVLPDDVDLALELLSDAIHQPAFKPSTVARERSAQLAEIAEDNDDIVTAARRRLRKLFFGRHPLAVEPVGTEQTVARIDAAALRALRRRLVVGPNTVLAVSGDFQRGQLLPKLRRILQRLPETTAVGQGASPPIESELGEHVEPLERQQVIVLEAYPMPGLLDPDYYVTEVTDELFSGMSSNLFERVREEKGLAYFVRSGRVIGLRTGMFMFMAGTSPQQHRELVTELEAEIARVRNGGVTKDELARCRTRLKAARRMSMQSNSACAAQAALNAIYGLPVNDWRDYDAHIDAVSAAQVQAFARDRLQRANRVRLLAGAVPP